jgi:hypothetical protein
VSALYQLAEDGMKKVTMRYEDGGKFEVWSWNNTSVRVPAMTSQEEVKRLLVEKAKA